MRRKNVGTGPWSVLVSAVMVNLGLGILYAWSVFQKELVYSWGWSHSAASIPYGLGIAVFTMALIVSGRLQDRIGPEKVVVAGVFLAGLGLVLSGLARQPITLTLAYGVVAAAGIGTGYACMIPAVMKWFPPQRKGTVTGLVVGGFGLSALVMAPLADGLVARFGLSRGMVVLGVLILLWGIGPALRIGNPPAGYAPRPVKSARQEACEGREHCHPWREMVKTPVFYQMWLMFFLSASAGFLVIGNIGSIALEQTGFTRGALLVSLLAVFNTLGRLGAGMLSDRLGRQRTLQIVFVMQGINMLIFPGLRTIALVMGATAVTGLGYGSLTSLFPSITADRFGVKNVGMNYGLVNTGWGLSGLITPVLAGLIVDRTGSYQSSFVLAGVLLALALAISLYKADQAETV